MPACYEKDWQFSWEIWAIKVHTSGENLLAYFLQFPWWKCKICRDQSRFTFSYIGFAAQFLAQGCATRLCSRLACLHTQQYMFSSETLKSHDIKKHHFMQSILAVTTLSPFVRLNPTISILWKRWANSLVWGRIIALPAYDLIIGTKSLFPFFLLTVRKGVSWMAVRKLHKQMTSKYLCWLELMAKSLAHDQQS